MKAENNKKLTVITPTYNRASTLRKCYDSLLHQTCFSFEWLLVDDGSTDNTETIVNEWIKETDKFKIRYVKKQNGGKASALNVAFAMLETQYACILDSDDYLVDTAVESFLKDKELADKDNNCCGVMAFRHNEDGTVMGGRSIPITNGRITMIDILNERFRTELFCFYKTSIVKQFRFPQFPNEKFVSPQWLDFELSRNYYFVPSNKQYCICVYIADGLTKNKKKVIVRNPRGYTAVKRQSFEFSKCLNLSIKHGLMYDCGCIIGKDKEWLENSPQKLLSIVLMPLAYLIYVIRFKGKY